MSAPPINLYFVLSVNIFQEDIEKNVSGCFYEHSTRQLTKAQTSLIVDLL